MKEKLTKNLGLKLISVFCAFFVWLAVVNVANPIKSGSQEVTVDIMNENVLSDKNLTYEIDGRKSATVTYRVRTKNAYRIKASDFRIYADLSEMYDVTGAIPLKVEVLNNEELFESTPVVKAPGVIKIKTEALQTKRFDLKVTTTGKQAEGYEPGEITLSPDFVYVKGPVSQVGQISEIGIEFDVDGASNDIGGVTTPIFYDANGNKLALDEKVTVLSNEIAYQLVMLKVKNLTLDFAVTGEVADGYRFTGVESELKNVPVAGLKSVLASISTLTIQNPGLNVDKATSDKVCEINLDDYMPDNVTIVGVKNHTIPVTLKVEALKERTFKLDTMDIMLDGKQENFIYEVDKNQIDVVIRGLKDDLDSLTEDNLNAVAHVSGYEAGTHEGVLTFNVDDSFEIVKYSDFNFVITDKDQESTSDASSASNESGDESSAEGTREVNETKEVKEPQATEELE